MFWTVQGMALPPVVYLGFSFGVGYDMFVFPKVVQSPPQLLTLNLTRVKAEYMHPAQEQSLFFNILDEWPLEVLSPPHTPISSSVNGMVTIAPNSNGYCKD